MTAPGRAYPEALPPSEVPVAVAQLLVALDDRPVDECLRLLTEVQLRADVARPQPFEGLIEPDPGLDRVTSAQVASHARRVLLAATRFDLGQLPPAYRRRVADVGFHGGEGSPRDLVRIEL